MMAGMVAGLAQPSWRAPIGSPGKSGSVKEMCNFDGGPADWLEPLWTSRSSHDKIANDWSKTDE